MKKKSIIFIVISIFILVSLYFVLNKKTNLNLNEEELEWLNKNRNSIRVLPDPNAEPLEFFDNGRFKGIAADFIKLIEKKMNSRFKIEESEHWESVFNRVKKGERAVLTAMVETENRKKDFIFTQSYFELKVIVLSKDNLDIRNLHNKKIVLVKGYAANETVEKNYSKDNELIYIDNIAEGLKMISLSRGDVFVIDNLTAAAYIKKEKIYDLKVIYEFPETFEMKMAVNKKYKILQSILNKSLNSISKREKNEIYDKWLTYKELIFWEKNKKIIIIVFTIFVLIILWNLSLYFMVKRRTRDLRITSNIFGNSSEGIVITDQNGEIIKVNKSFQEMTGYDESELIGENPRIIKSEKHEDQFYKNMWKDLLTVGEWKGEVWNRRKNGEVYPVWLLINALKNNKNEVINYVSIAQDLTIFKENQDNINWLSNHDIITGLPNQTLFRDRIKLEREEIENTDEKFAIIYINVDNFKFINDAFGYAKGDQVLYDIAQRIKKILKSKCILSRISGDEYGIMVSHLENIRELEEIAKSILKDFKIPFKIKDKEVLITASLGLAIYPEDVVEEESIINAGHLALKHAKTLGKNNYSFYMKHLNRESSKRLKMEYHLKNVILKDELYINYQPQIDIKTGLLTGVEALLRWNNSELGIISPGVFIPLAEETGMIIPIGQWMLKKACSDMKLLHELGFDKVNLSANLSVIELKQNDFIKKVSDILKETEFNPMFLEFEITEGFLLENEKMNREKLEKIKKAGIKISIDDFGTGFSSLGYLKRFSFDKLKIDQSFIRNIPNREDESISKTIIQLANNLNLKVIAEGVETKEQYEFLKENSCDEIQGYYFSKPLAYSDLINYLLRNNKIK